jgi:hypothetical protein
MGKKRLDLSYRNRLRYSEYTYSRSVSLWRLPSGSTPLPSSDWSSWPHEPVGPKPVACASWSPTAWTISYTATARKQLRNLDRPIARRIVDFMDERIAGQADPRSTGRALTGPLLGALAVSSR